MRALAPYHPIIVHFAVALVFVGVPLRWLSFWPKAKFANGAAVLLLLGAGLAGWLAASSGDAAHPPAERIPGARPAVQEHEELGERARNVFLAVAVLELIALGLSLRKPPSERPPRARQATLLLSALLGTIGLYVMYETAEHGGRLVYSFAGGVGTRTGAPQDVDRLLLAGLYQKAAAEREAGRPEQAAELVDIAAGRFPDSTEVALWHADSLLRDRHDPNGAIAALGAIEPEGGSFLELRRGLLLAQAQAAAGQADEARRVLEALKERFPQSRAIDRVLEGL